MRIMSVITCFGRGGAEVLVGDLCRNFKASGHECTVVALSSASHIGASSDNEQAMLDELDGSGIGHVSLKIANRKNLLKLVPSLRKAIKGFQPDVIHVHTAQALLALAFLRPRQPVIYTHHNSVLGFPAILFRLFDTIVASYIAIGPTCGSMLGRHARNTIVQILNAVQPPVSPPRSIAPEAAQLTIASVGFLSQQKNYGQLLEVASLLKGRFEEAGHPMPHFKIAGGGDQLEGLRAAVNEKGLSGIVEFLGPTNGSAALLGQADIMLNCSLWEGLPIALIEALHAGLPIIAPDVGDVSSVVEDGKNGYLVRPGHALDMADRLQKLVLDKDLREAMGRASKGKAEDFSINACADAHLSLYRSLIDGRNTNR